MADRRAFPLRRDERDDCCEVCHKIIRGTPCVQDGRIAHFGCIDHNRAWSACTSTAAHRLSRPCPTRPSSPPGLRPARRPPTGRAAQRHDSAQTLGATAQTLRSARYASSYWQPRSRAAFADVMDIEPRPMHVPVPATTVASPRGRLPTSREHPRAELQRPRPQSTHVRAVLMSGCQHDLWVPSSHALRVCDIRGYIATATARLRTHVLLVSGTRILQGHWRIDEAFEHTKSVEVSVVVTQARIPLEDVMDPTSPETDYVSDIHAKLRADEAKYLVPVDSMAWQADVTKKMRAILVDWFVDVQRRFKLRDEALYIAVHLVDRYLHLKQTTRRKLQLIGITCFSVAAKFDQDDGAPRNRDWAHVTDGAYTQQEITACECAVLSALDFDVARPSVANFLDLYNQIDKRSGSIPHLAHYLLQLSLVHGPTVFDKASSYEPSRLAAASILLSNKLESQRPAWSQQMAMYTGYRKEDLTSCANELYAVLQVAEKGALHAVHKKFARQEYSCVSQYCSCKMREAD